MRVSSRACPSLLPATLVALSLATCVGVVGGTGPAVTERRSLQEQEQAVASLMACLEAAARSLAGQTAVIREADPAAVVPTPPASAPPRLTDAPRVASAQHRLDLLNLPPPAASI